MLALSLSLSFSLQPGLLTAGLQKKSHNQADVENTEHFKKTVLFVVNHAHELRIDGTKVYFRVPLNMKLPVSSKRGCLLIVLK